MSCTTILAGRKATYNGSTLISRNDDSSSGEFTVKRYEVVLPDMQPSVYHSVISHVEIPLPSNPMRYTSMPNANPKEKGLWAAGGINSANVGMTATETITTNVRVLAADPLVEYDPLTKKPGGIGEEDIVVLTLPYIHTARKGVERLGKLLETYGTYESNGIAFNDADEVWYMETIGGHHWIARRIPDDCYAVIANEFSIDSFDLQDALGAQKNYMASADIVSFIEDNHLNLNMNQEFDARLAFGSHTNIDHLYNTPRVWYGQQYFNPTTVQWRGDTSPYTPMSDNIPFCRVPEFKITVEDIKTVLSSVYQGTPYDPYGKDAEAGKYRPIGINRTSFVGVMEIRNDVPADVAGIEWFSFACNVFNALVPQYTQINSVPDYFGKTSEDDVSTDSFYWINRIISAMADPHFRTCSQALRRYKMAVGSQARALMKEHEVTGEGTLEAVNQQIADMTKKETQKLLDEVLYISSMAMKNAYTMSDN